MVFVDGGAMLGWAHAHPKVALTLSTDADRGLLLSPHITCADAFLDTGSSLSDLFRTQDVAVKTLFC